MSGANGDVISIYFQYYPTASNIDVFEGDTVNVGASGKFLQGVGGEVNFAREEGKRRPTIGGTVYYTVAGIGINIPFPPLEICANWTRTAPFQFRRNIVRYVLGLPQEE